MQSPRMALAGRVLLSTAAVMATLVTGENAPPPSTENVPVPDVDERLIVWFAARHGLRPGLLATFFPTAGLESLAAEVDADLIRVAEAAR